MKILNRISALLLVIACHHAAALQDDFSAKVVIESERQTIDMKANIVKYIGDVRVTQGTLQIFADQLSILNATEDGLQILVAEGKPARYTQVLDNGKVMDAEAAKVRYELGTRELLLTGQAKLVQEDSLVEGDRISYNLEKQLLEADSNKDSQTRVRSIFIPEQIQQQFEDDKKKNKAQKEDK